MPQLLVEEHDASVLAAQMIDLDDLDASPLHEVQEGPQGRGSRSRSGRRDIGRGSRSGCKCNSAAASRHTDVKEYNKKFTAQIATLIVNKASQPLILWYLPLLMSLLPLPGGFILRLLRLLLLGPAVVGSAFPRVSMSVSGRGTRVSSTLKPLGAPVDDDRDDDDDDVAAVLP